MYGLMEDNGIIVVAFAEIKKKETKKVRIWITEIVTGSNHVFPDWVAIYLPLTRIYKSHCISRFAVLSSHRITSKLGVRASWPYRH